MNIAQINPKCYHNESLDLVGFGTGTWQFMYSKQLKKHAPDLRIENHVLRSDITKKIEYVRDDIKIVIHPAVKGSMNSTNIDVISPSFHQAMKKMDRTLILNHRPYSFPSLLCRRIFREKPYIVHRHGGGGVVIKELFAGGEGLGLYRYNPYNFFLSVFKKHIVDNIDLFLSVSRVEQREINKIGIPTRLFQTGVDMDLFRSTRTVMNESGKKRLIYIGGFFRKKGVDIVIKTHQQLKRKFDIELVCIGGETHHELYDYVHKHADIAIDRVPHHEIVDHLFAADVYVLIPPTMNIIKYSGIGTATVEAMMCNTPVVSNSLIHFANLADLDKVGIIPGSDYYGAIVRILENQSDYANCSEVAGTYYDWKNIVSSILPYYEEVYSKYY